MQWTEDPRYLPGDGDSRERRALSPSEANVTFKCAALKSRADCRRQEILHSVAQRVIKTREKLLVDCGMSYSF